MTIIDGLRLTGEFVNKLADKNFTVMKMFKKKMKLPGAEEEEEKWQITIKLTDGKIRDWIPNATTLQTLADKFGDDSDNFIGKKAKFRIVVMKVRGQETKVIYVE